MSSLSTETLEEFGKQHVVKGLGRITTGIMAKGAGSYVDMEDGRHMLDFTCGIGVTNLGELIVDSLNSVDIHETVQM